MYDPAFNELISRLREKESDKEICYRVPLHGSSQRVKTYHNIPGTKLPSTRLAGITHGTGFPVNHK